MTPKETEKISNWLKQHILSKTQIATNNYKNYNLWVFVLFPIFKALKFQTVQE